MATFYYTAKSQKGETKTGTLEAKDKHALAQALRIKGYILTSARSLKEEEPALGPLRSLPRGKAGEASGPAKGRKKSIFKISFGRISLVDKLMFARHLAVMIGAGFSLNQGLELLVKQTENQKFKGIIKKLVDDIKKGKTLAESMAKYPRVFNGFFVSMIGVGEKGGSLEEVLKILARYLKREHDLKSRVRGAMFYPIIILVAMTGIGILMMLMVVPKLMVIFEEMNVELPVTTQILIKISKFLGSYFYIGVIAFLVLAFILVKFYRSKTVKRTFGYLALKVPIFGKIVQKVNCARFARSFASLTKSGLPIIESLKTTSQTLGNIFYSNSLIEASESIKKGKKIQESLEGHRKLYPVLVIQMIGVGEQTGELSGIMERLADFYEEEVKNITDNLASVIEPILMIILGGAVGFFAISMIQPMYSMMGTL